VNSDQKRCIEHLDDGCEALAVMLDGVLTDIGENKYKGFRFVLTGMQENLRRLTPSQTHLSQSGPQHLSR
jgi:hypothetical protein